MKLERTLFQKSYLYFLGFFLLMTFGFWLTYFTKLLEQENYRMHTHGISLILWCVMLVTQAYLIRIKNKALHKQIGKSSYLIVPLVVFTTLDLLKFRIDKSQALGTLDFFFIALVINALIAFLWLYGLAIYYKKEATIHARFMVCTIFPMFTPITDRIISIHFPNILPYFPTIEGTPIVPLAGFLLADLMLISLCIWDWQSHKRWNVFALALFILLLYHYSVLNFHKFPFWQSFCQWFFAL
ncbi:MAG: hypothetical protein R2822_12450 [Spirosomataceae bacterium]